MTKVAIIGAGAVGATAAYYISKSEEVDVTVFDYGLGQATKARERVGIRAYTSDFSPFYGEVPDLPNVFVASGLGSTGLTVGPLIGHELAMLILGQEGWLAEADYPVCRYISPTKG